MDTTGNIPTTVTLTSDVKPQWLNVIRRLQSACHGNQGYAVLSISILINSNGEPVSYLEPLLRKIEPKSLTSEALLALTDVP